jgi:hypothetical protein
MRDLFEKFADETGLDVSWNDLDERYASRQTELCAMAWNAAIANVLDQIDRTQDAQVRLIGTLH